jgi:hypothetical protein
MLPDYVGTINNTELYIICAYGFAALMLASLILHTIIRSRRK